MCARDPLQRRTLTPAETASDAQVCRRSCGVMGLYPGAFDRRREPPAVRLGSWQIPAVAENEITLTLAPASRRS